MQPGNLEVKFEKDTRYRIGDKMSIFEVGDKVRVTRKATSHENGWENSWEPCMNDAVGKVGTVESVSTYGVRLKFSGINAGSRYQYPEFVLEKIVEPVLKVTVQPVFKVGDKVRLTGKFK